MDNRLPKCKNVKMQAITPNESDFKLFPILVVWPKRCKMRNIVTQDAFHSIARIPACALDRQDACHTFRLHLSGHAPSWNGPLYYPQGCRRATHQPRTVSRW